MKDADRHVCAVNLAGKLMLGQDFEPSRYENHQYITQPKLDGIRAIWAPAVGFVSRQGTLFPDKLVEHIQIDPSCDAILDGEMYCHGMMFQDIMSAITPMKSTPTENTLKIKFHVFDGLNIGSNLRHRLNNLHRLRHKFIDNVEVVSHGSSGCWESLAGSFAGYVGAGYEGMMIKEPDAHYVNGRTDVILKWKAWKDDKFECVGFSGGQGKYSNTLGAIKFVTKQGKTFDCSGMTDAMRDEMWNNRNDFLTRVAEVKYLTLSRDRIPLKPQFVKWL